VGAFGAMREGVRSVEEVPVNIEDLDISAWVGVPIQDPDENRPFTMLKPEIKLCQRARIAPPRRHFIARMRDLIWMQNTGLFEPSQCASCKKELIVSVNRTFRTRKIYCCNCYLKFIENRG
jgi:hypothetical protein